MKRGCALLALGLGLLAAPAGRANEPDAPGPVFQPAPAPGNGGACGARGPSCGGCAAYCGSCWERLCNFFTFRGSRSPCCNTCCSFCTGCYCYPPPYVYFLGDDCREGRNYLTHRCGGCGGCGNGCGGCGSEGCGRRLIGSLPGPLPPPPPGPDSQAPPPAAYPMPAPR
jgi:hypothetical protein